MVTVAIIGAGAAGCALAADLVRRGGAGIALYDIDPAVGAALRAAGGVRHGGFVGDGLARVGKVAASPADAVRGADVVVIATTADRHDDVATSLAPHLADGQAVVLYCGYVAGTILFERALRQAGCRARLHLAETMNTIHLCGTVEPGHVFVSAAKRWLEVTGLAACDTDAVLERLGKLLPELAPGSNALETGLNNPNAIGHVPAAVFNFGHYGAPATETTTGTLHFDELSSPPIRRIGEALDAERIAVMAALGLRPIARSAFAERSYPPGSRIAGAPPRFGRKLLARHLDEDVPCALVPYVSFGELAGVETPVARLLLEAAGRLRGRDEMAEGRSVARIGRAAIDAQLAAARARSQ